jgi:multisubunit Na+/H+ antiporter MnhC subunit
MTAAAILLALVLSVPAFFLLRRRKLPKVVIVVTFVSVGAVMLLFGLIFRACWLGDCL